MTYITIETNDSGESWVGTFTKATKQQNSCLPKIMEEEDISETDMESFSSDHSDDGHDEITSAMIEDSMKQHDHNSILDSTTSSSSSSQYRLELRAMQELFPAAPDHELNRFLKARHYNVTNASAMYEAHLEWRKQTLPVHKQEVEETLATRKYYVLDDLDADGHPVIVFCLRRFHEMSFDPTIELRAMVYMFENQIKPRFVGCHPDQHKVTVLVDVTGGYRNAPLSFFRHANAIMEANFPDVLFRAVLCPVPYWLQKLLGGILSFIREETRAKLVCVNDAKSLREAAQLSIDKMGPDIQTMIQNKQLR